MSAVEVCPDCDIAGCAHIRNRTGAFAALSQPSVTVEEIAEIIAEAIPQHEDMWVYAPAVLDGVNTIAKAILARYTVTVKG